MKKDRKPASLLSGYRYAKGWNGGVPKTMSKRRLELLNLAYNNCDVGPGDVRVMTSVVLDLIDAPIPLEPLDKSVVPIHIASWLRGVFGEAVEIKSLQPLYFRRRSKGGKSKPRHA
jgi:hypothetical protein